MDSVIKFLQSQKLLAIATADSAGAWIANVYFVSDDSATLYFISPESTRHSQMIIENSTVAISVAWFDPKNHVDRKAVQATGSCTQVVDSDEIRKAIQLHNSEFPEFAKRITPEWIATNEFGSRVWKIVPDFIKYWDDELFGDDESVEINVSRETFRQTS